jgi:hypothetical protein
MESELLSLNILPLFDCFLAALLLCLVQVSASILVILYGGGFPSRDLIHAAVLFRCSADRENKEDEEDA